MKEILQKTWAIAWKNLLVLSKDRGEVAILFLMPLLFASLISISAGGGGGEDDAGVHFDVYVVNEDSGPYGEMVEDTLAEMTILRIETLDSAAEADRLVGEGERLAAIVIPAGFSVSSLSRAHAYSAKPPQEPMHRSPNTSFPG